MAAAVDEVRLYAMELGPVSHRAVVAAPIPAPHRPDERDPLRPDLVEELGPAPAAPQAHEEAARLLRKLITRHTRPSAHGASQLHEPSLLEPLDLVGHEAYSHVVPGELRDVAAEAFQLHEYVGLVRIDHQLPAAATRRSEAGDQAVEVLARGDDRDERLRLRSRQLEQFVLDVGFASQAVRAAR